MLKYRLVATAATLLLASSATLVEAGDWHHRYERHHHHGRTQAIIGTDGLPSVVPGIGTFSGGISALRIKGNGVFIAVDGGVAPQVIDYRAPKAKIIEVSAENQDEACSFEAGVCVIRPDY